MPKPKLPPRLALLSSVAPLLDPETPSRLRRFLTLPRVMAVTGLARAAVYKKMSEGGFPRQIRLMSKPDAKRFVAVWDEDEIAEWQEARLAERDQERPTLPINRPEVQARAKQIQHRDRLSNGMPLPPLPPLPRKARARRSRNKATAELSSA